MTEEEKLNALHARADGIVRTLLRVPVKTWGHCTLYCAALWFISVGAIVVWQQSLLWFLWFIPPTLFGAVVALAGHMVCLRTWVCDECHGFHEEVVPLCFLERVSPDDGIVCPECDGIAARTVALHEGGAIGFRCDLCKHEWPGEKAAAAE